MQSFLQLQIKMSEALTRSNAEQRIVPHLGRSIHIRINLYGRAGELGTQSHTTQNKTTLITISSRTSNIAVTPYLALYHILEVFLQHPVD